MPVRTLPRPYVHPEVPLDEITPRLRAVLDDPARPTPFVALDLGVVAERYRSLAAALPGATLFYAVKANPAAPVLRLLHRLGASFDVASPVEIDLCLAVGADPATLSYGNTMKKRADIAYAHGCGVRRFAVDCPEELAKVLEHAPGAQVIVRLFHDCEGADWPLSRKFGCEAPDALALLVAAGRAGVPTGLTFHVGSQQRSTAAWDPALAVAARLWRSAADAGHAPSLVNVGGGFPGRYSDAVAPISAYGAAIEASLARHFGPDTSLWPQVAAEPGRYLVADAGALATEVVLVSRRSPDDAKRWVYLDCGVFGGLVESLGEAIRYRFETPHDGGRTGPVCIAGPTCDSADVLYEKADYELPVALRDGDRVVVHSAGSYTTAYASVGFNGFAPPAEYFVGEDDAAG